MPNFCEKTNCFHVIPHEERLCVAHSLEESRGEKKETPVARDTCHLNDCQQPRIAGSELCGGHQQFFSREDEKKETTGETSQKAILWDDHMYFGSGLKKPDFNSPETKKETTGENSQKALRYNSGKLRLNLLPWEWQKWLTELLMVGAKKYSDDNWKESLNTADHNSFVADRKESLKRHLLQYDSGELTDEESGIRHMVMIAWNALVIACYDYYGAAESHYKKEPTNEM